jgi:TonB family protein
MKTGLAIHGAFFESDPQDRRFRFILWVSIVVYTLLAIGVASVKIQLPPRVEVGQLPPRIAKLIIPPKVEVPPKPEGPTITEEAKPEEKPKEEVPKETEVASKPPPSPEEIAEQERRRNIEIAMNSGLLKLLKRPDQSVSDTKLKKTFSEIQELKSSPKDTSKPGIALHTLAQSSGIDDVVSQLEKTLKDSKVVISDKALSSGGIAVPQTQGTGEHALKERKAASVENPFQIKGYEDGKSPRSYESILEVVEGYKGGISFIYNKALRTNPTLRGTVTVEFTIAASGEVVECKVVTSSMNDPTFEDTLAKRILQWRFPSIPAGDVTVIYPIVFYVTG